MQKYLELAAHTPQVQRDLLELKRHLAIFEDALGKIGVQSGPSSLQVWQEFASKSDEDRTAILVSLLDSIDLIDYSVRASSKSAELTSKQLTWYALKRMGLRAPSNLFNQIDDDDYIEIYNGTGIQIFRDFEFFKLISYSIAEMTVFRWDQLFDRDAAVKQQIVEQGFVRGFSGVTEPYRLDIDTHAVREAFSSAKWRYTVRFGYLSPIFDANQRVTAILATSKIKRMTN